MMDRRRQPRLPIAVPTRLRSLYFADDVGMTRDLSTKGARITTLHSFRIGERVRLTLKSPVLNGGGVSVEGRVAYFEEQAPGEALWHAEVGIAFDSTIPNLLPLIEFMTPETPTDSFYVR